MVKTTAMSNIWHRRILAGDQNVNDVPKRFLGEVILLFKQDVQNDVISSEQFEDLMGFAYMEDVERY